MSDDLTIRPARSEDIPYLSKSVKDLVEHTRLSTRDSYFIDLDKKWYTRKKARFLTGAVIVFSH